MYKNVCISPLFVCVALSLTHFYVCAFRWLSGLLPQCLETQTLPPPPFCTAPLSGIPDTPHPQTHTPTHWPPPPAPPPHPAAIRDPPTGKPDNRKQPKIKNKPSNSQNPPDFHVAPAQILTCRINVNLALLLLKLSDVAAECFTWPPLNNGA